jgi:hypothetical protein
MELTYLPRPNLTHHQHRMLKLHLLKSPVLLRFPRLTTDHWNQMKVADSGSRTLCLESLCFGIHFVRCSARNNCIG